MTVQKVVLVPTKCGPNTWAGLVLVITALEMRAGYKFSHFVRSVLRTDTLPGKVAFVGGWAWLTVWFLPHILKGPGETV